MEEKYPIKFSLGQLVMILGLQVVIMALIFLLGARFGSDIFSDSDTKSLSGKDPYQVLEPQGESDGREMTGQVSRLVDTLEEEEPGPDAGAVQFQVGAQGELLEEEETQEEEAVFPEAQPGQNSLFNRQAHKDTMIRFKSSGHTKFAIEVGEYFDELLASQKIRQLKERGYDAYLVIKNPEAAAPGYLVRVGTFADRQLAEDFATEMSNKQDMELQVVQTD